MKSRNWRYVPTVANFAIVQKEGNRLVERIVEHYNIDNIVYHIGASLKDLGKKLFAFSKMGLPAESLLVV